MLGAVTPVKLDEKCFRLSFQVTNAQHPDALRALCPVTQLYLSIDAATESDLKRLGKTVIPSPVAVCFRVCLCILDLCLCLSLYISVPVILPLSAELLVLLETLCFFAACLLPCFLISRSVCTIVSLYWLASICICLLLLVAVFPAIVFVHLKTSARNA